MKQAVFKIKDMHCAACSSRIEKALNKAPGVEKAVVNLATLKATITYDDTCTTIEKLLGLIEKLGYTPAVADKQVIKKTFKVEGMT